MPPRTSAARFPAAALAVLWSVVCAGPLGRVVRGQDAGAEPLPPPVVAVRGDFHFKGTEFCVRCHRSEQGEWADGATTAAWRHDAHSRSHLALLSDNPRTRAMEQALGIKAAHTFDCIACHTHPVDEPALEEETTHAHSGISCETCHGAGSGYFEPHMEKAWRFLSAEEKATRGMRDLRDPELKAHNCLGCHVGDPGSGRLVTHAMYAAGHPPLPAFEMESFGRAMGPHWKRVWEKAPRVREAAAAAGYATEGADETHRALVGALVALERSATLVTEYASAEERPWPEFSLYDCAACHHELRVPSRRQAALPGGRVPGRPSLPRWPRALAGVALDQADMPTDIDATLADLLAPLDRTPFGARADLHRPPAAALGRVREAIRRLRAVPADAGLAGRRAAVVAALARAGEASDDFESARLLGWTLAAALDADASWPDATRAAAVRRLTDALGLGFPQPAYPAAEAGERPFWQTSLSAAAAADMGRIHEAFRLPPRGE